MAHTDYLERSEVKGELQVALRELVTKQPDDPISFLARHFDNLVKPTREATLVSADLLKGTDALDHVQLDSEVYKTFLLLSDTDNYSPDNVLAGRVQGVAVNKLIRELCGNLNPHTADLLLCKLQVPPESVLSYPSFKATVTPRLNLQAFLKIAKEVFDSIDMQQTGTIRRQVGEDILSRLSGNLFTTASDTHSESSAKSLSPAEITSIIQRASQREDTMSFLEFEKEAGQLFVNHIPINTSV